MKKILLSFFLFPSLCYAQGQFYDRLAIDEVNKETKESIKRSYWQVFERGNLHRTMNTFYRLSCVNNSFYLDLKVMQGGDAFVVPRSGKFELLLESGDIVTLNSTAFKASSKGDGSRHWAGSSAEGMTLTFPVSDDDMKLLLHDYVASIRLYSYEGFVQRKITYNHSELFRDEVSLIYHASR